MLTIGLLNRNTDCQRSSIRLQLPTPLVSIGCLLSDPIPLPKRRIICRPTSEQINTYYTAGYFTEFTLSETHTQKINQINILNNKQVLLNNTQHAIYKHLASVIRIIDIITTNASYAKAFFLVWLVAIGYMSRRCTLCLKTIELIFYHDFGKCRPIFKILAAIDFQRNSLRKHYRVFHLTLTVLLHQLAKFKN